MLDIPALPRLATLPLAAIVMLTGCATTGATLGSGVGDAHLERPPYYAGALPGGGQKIAHLPISYQRGAGQAAIFDPEARSGTAVDALLIEMNAYLDSLLQGSRLQSTSLPGIAPDVRFGCAHDVSDECDREAHGGREDRPRMRLAVGRPSPEWTAAFARTLDQASAQSALVLTLEVGQYWVRQRGIRGTKEVYLGSGHTQQLPWLTSLDQPVQVLQLTGALVGPDGKAIRIGAEGLFARRTNIILSGFGAQALISEDDVKQVRGMRRDDLAGSPLVWQVALRNLVSELTHRPEIAAR